MTAPAELFHDATEHGSDALGDTQCAIDEVLENFTVTDQQQKVLEKFKLNITSCQTRMDDTVAEGRTHLRVLEQKAVEYHVINHGGSHDEATKARLDELAAIWAGKDSGREDPAAYLHQKDMDLEDEKNSTAQSFDCPHEGYDVFARAVRANKRCGGVGANGG